MLFNNFLINFFQYFYFIVHWVGGKKVECMAKICMHQGRPIFIHCNWIRPDLISLSLFFQAESRPFFFLKAQDRPGLIIIFSGRVQALFFPEGLGQAITFFFSLLVFMGQNFQSRFQLSPYENHGLVHSKTSKN